jgi:hypothetical protein
MPFLQKKVSIVTLLREINCSSPRYKTLAYRLAKKGQFAYFFYVLFLALRIV